MLHSIRSTWLKMSISHKMKLFVILLVIGITVAAAINIYAIRYSFSGVGQNLSDITLCENAQEAMENEVSSFQEYLRDRTDSNRTSYLDACTHTRATLNLLPYNYRRIGAERYARTWNIRNAYQNYSEARDALAATGLESGSGGITEMYRIYGLQNYISGYLRNLSQLTAQESSEDYEAKSSTLQAFPYIVGLFSFAVILAAIIVGSMFSNAIVPPITKLASSAREMRGGNFDVPDTTVPNQDELGELVEAFNGMKKAAQRSITALEENQKLSERLHEEQMDRMETERQLNTAQLDLLQSQIKPHFLFNTLNTISGMAELENADTTAQMIRSLSNLFRYNLHTTEQFVALSQELSIVQDYMYLQKTRFGDRVNYELHIDDGIDPSQIQVPVFLLQPLVENSVSHGLNRKEQGGTVRIDVRMTHTGGEPAAVITVSDTGAGIFPDQLSALRESLTAGQRQTNAEGGHTGIGLSNIYKRITTIYQHGSMRIDSTEGIGTAITLVIPQPEALTEQSESLSPGCCR